MSATIQAAVYSRKSTEQRASEEDRSCVRQIANARAFAAAKGWHVADEHVYTDDGVSGVRTKALVSKARMLSAIAAPGGPPFQALVMQANDRLSRRDGDEALAELKAIARAGVAIWFYADGTMFEHGTIQSNMYNYFKAEFAAEYRRSVSAKTREALVRRAQLGHVAGGACFGYDQVRVGSHVERTVNRDEAAVVCDIYRRYAAGEGLANIAHGLNRKRVRCPRPQQQRVSGWCPSSVRSVLRRPLYRGQIVYGQRGRPVGADPESKPVLMPKDSWLLATAEHLRIVPERLAEIVDARFASQKTRCLRISGGRILGRAPGEGSPFLLTGLLLCGVCGGGMDVGSGTTGSGSSRRRTWHYRCLTRRRKGVACCTNKLTAPMGDADSAVMDAIADTLLSPEVVEQAIAHAERLLAGADGEEAQRRAGIERELREATAAVSRLTKAVAQGGPLDSLVDALSAAERRQVALRGELAEISKPKARPDGAKVRAELRSYLDDWRGLLRGHVHQSQQILRRLIVGRLTFVPKGKHYEFRGVGTVRPLLGGVVPKLASPPGIEPGSRP